jgi:rfaE bifunctional protein kinase chain/domain
LKTFDAMTRVRLEEILECITGVRAAVFGDLCLDVYWHADMRMSELSRETPHFALPVVREEIYLGGGGNVAANLAALVPRRVYASGTAGDDWRGHELARLMQAMKINTGGIVSAPHLVTNAFCKPMRRGISDTVYEDPRLDFANIHPLGDEVEYALIAALDKIAADIDILCVSDQLPTNVYGAVTERVRAHILFLAQRGLTVVADSRDRVALYTGVIVKPNEIEAARATREGKPASHVLDKNGHITESTGEKKHTTSIEDFAVCARVLAHNREVIMTLGPLGSVYSDGGEPIHITARNVSGPIDTVGAGDSFLAGFALAAAAGASRPEAAFFAGLCSEVTIQKIGTTGTASPEEILAWYGANEK